MEVGFSKYFGLPQAASFQQCSMFIHSFITDAIQSQELTVLLNNTLLNNTLNQTQSLKVHATVSLF